MTTHVTPIRALQALLPILRTNPSRARDSVSNSHGSKSIIVCVPATDARVGLPFSSAQAMSAAATLRGIEVLRREINAAALTDTTDSMKNISVVVVDVGSFSSSNAPPLSPQDLHKTLEDWTPAEKVAYGSAFSSILEQRRQYGVRRKPTDVSHLVNALVEVVSGGQKGSGRPVALGLGLGKLRNWIRGDRFAIGAGGKFFIIHNTTMFGVYSGLTWFPAGTYTMASYLPSYILNTLLAIPHFLISARNALLPITPQPFLPPQPPVASPVVTTTSPAIEVTEPTEEQELSEHEASDTGSEADAESNSSGVESSWIHA